MALQPVPPPPPPPPPPPKAVFLALGVPAFVLRAQLEATELSALGSFSLSDGPPVAWSGPTQPPVPGV